ncbi:MAG: GDSL-type esterase/lipase family protein [Deltaproteobacteria bacterium]|nr:GDSL-type esterase/lipase family protein [Deltaproteobacteria bacterium]
MIRQFFLITLVTFLLLVLGCSGDGDNKENMPPSADAGTDQTVEEKSLVSLSGSGTDSDGTVESYLWSQWSGPATNLNNKDTAHATFTAPEVTEETILTFRLTVTDNGGASDSDDVTVKVNPVNLPPTTDAGLDQFVPGQTLVTLSGSGSDGDGNNDVTYAWTQVEGTEVTINNADRETASFTAPDVTECLAFRLTVTDNEGATASDDVTISVSSILFSDDFDDGNSYGWTVFDNSGYSSYWLVVDGEYVQWNVVERRDSFDQSYHLGTCSYINSGSDWTNYRLMVEVTPLSNNPEDDAQTQGNDVGVIFRRQDNDNYYRLTLNSRYGFTRLEKKADGVFSTLAVDSAGYYEGEALNITIEVNGSLIQVFVDDEPLFGVLDSDPIDSGSIALYCQDKAKFDDVLIMENSPASAITVSSPVAYSIETTDTFDVSAIATNVPQGGSIKFILDNDDMTSIVDSDFPYTAQFTGVSQDEHILDTILRDDSGSEIARDSNVQIGRGDYYVAVGDSITNGVGDDDSSYNTSQDGRTIAIQGYEANLNDLLTSTLNYPHIVFNEGIGGDTSAKAVGRIDSILERHPGSNKVLILLGTNDANSGVDPFEFGSNMQDLINMVPEGKEIWVALVPPVFEIDGTFNPDSTGNQLILQYNAVIVNELKGVQPLHPDFFEFFKTRPSLFADELHPNGLGYEAMAYLWHNELNEDNYLALPPYLENP